MLCCVGCIIVNILLNSGECKYSYIGIIRSFPILWQIKFVSQNALVLSIIVINNISKMSPAKIILECCNYIATQL